MFLKLKTQIKGARFESIIAIVKITVTRVLVSE